MFKSMVITLFLTSVPVLASGLKKVNYENQTVETKARPSGGAGSSSGLSPEEQKKLTEQVNQIKKNQEESQKILDELDNEE